MTNLYLSAFLNLVTGCYHLLLLPRGWLIPQDYKLGYNQDYWGVNERAVPSPGGRSAPCAQDQTAPPALPARLHHTPRPQSRTRQLPPAASPHPLPQAHRLGEEALGDGVFAGQAADPQDGQAVIWNLITQLMIKTIAIQKASPSTPINQEGSQSPFNLENWFPNALYPSPCPPAPPEQLPFAANKILILILMQDKYHRALGLVVREVSLQAFEQYILQSSQSYLQLFRNIRQAETQGLPRFNVWRMLLKIMPFEGSWEDKRQALEGSRKRWATTRDEARNGPKNPLVKEAPVMPKNPLMKNIVRPEKKQTDSDPFLLQEIKKDVDRTYQQMEFFQEESILKLLTNVLFVWCKLNADISYKQGMNELLASVVYVYFQEAIPADYVPNNETEERFHFLNSLTHAEADIFAAFEKIMAIQKFMFKENLDGKIRGEVNPNSKNNSPILQRIIYLQDHKLKALDLELFRIIKLQDVRTKTFLLRWIRCLHTRQFGLFNSLPIWDSILLDALQSPDSSQKNEFQFIDAVCLAMFIYMRALVFTRETANQIQKIYQKYPQLEGDDLKQLIALAWSVTEELRATSKNVVSQTSNANWFEDTGKTKDLGLMDKGKDAIYKSKLEEKKDKGKFQDFAEEKLYPELDSKHQSSPEVHKHTPPPKVEASPKPLAQQKQVSQQKPRQKVQIQHPSPVKPKRDVIFSEDQVRGLIQSLKRSITLNDDIESRALSNQALHVLEQRLRR